MVVACVVAGRRADSQAEPLHSIRNRHRQRLAGDGKQACAVPTRNGQINRHDLFSDARAVFRRHARIGAGARMGLVFAQRIRLPVLRKINRRNAFDQISRAPWAVHARCATIASRNQRIKIFRKIRTVVRHHRAGGRQRLVHEFQFGVQILREGQRLGDIQFFGQFRRDGISL